ncbi:hypothetical protein [Methylomarinum vadi]|uniref:hypothetical protein n=1 Tax=Methylomarinum vadi TaxID=438855 RepID=UPI0004DF9B84|nr:hypothetical protein [Methylomarinum vadi]
MLKNKKTKFTEKNLAMQRYSLAFVSLLISLPLSAQTTLMQSDFDNGTYIIDQPGTYVLGEDISFNPHPVGSLGPDGVTPLDAYTAGLPFPQQLGMEYDPAAFGIGFFAAITIEADNVTLDLNGHTLEQSPEHALLQRFYANIELADQPFVPSQGPSDFGDELKAAKEVSIINGVIGRSSHHGIHGNGNRNLVIKDVRFKDFEVAAVALNGVNGVDIINSTASNREDVPIIGTFSNARFISAYVDWLVMSGSTTTLKVQGVELNAGDIQAALRTSINNVYDDVITKGLGFIDENAHPDEYALYHNKFGVIDGNSYGFLVNPLGVAVNGFPTSPINMSMYVNFRNVDVTSQKAFINEVVALQQGGKAAIDPIGAVFMVRNVHPDTGLPVTTSSLDESVATYKGNALANAQALVAKAALNGEFPSFLDVSRLNITQDMIDWIENESTLDSLVSSPADYLCNGDTMFHVNKGVIGFKLDGAKFVSVKNSSVDNLVNLGAVGSGDCGNYAISHPAATLNGYGGAKVRGFSIAASDDVSIMKSSATNLTASNGSVIGIDILTDSKEVAIKGNNIGNIEAGLSFNANGGPNEAPDAVGVQVGADANNVYIWNNDITGLDAFDEAVEIRDLSGSADY